MADQRPVATTGDSPSLCRNGCGFFGSGATEGMCSKCFRDHQRRKVEQQSNTPRKDVRQASEACAPVVGGQDPLQATPLSELPASPQPDSPQKTPKRNRCFVCRKKVGLTGFECRCGQVFCGLHRYADKHNCSYDYKSSGRAELEKKHPRVVASKIQKL